MCFARRLLHRVWRTGFFELDDEVVTNTPDRSYGNHITIHYPELSLLEGE